MKLNFLLLILLFFKINTYGQKAEQMPYEINKAKLIDKHWAGNCVSFKCDTLTFDILKKYNSKFYQWGSGYVEGLELYSNGTAKTFRNVHCSSESNPEDSFLSKWEIQGDTLIIEGHYINVKYKILSLDKKLKMSVLEFETKNAEK